MERGEVVSYPHDVLEMHDLNSSYKLLKTFGIALAVQNREREREQWVM